MNFQPVGITGYAVAIDGTYFHTGCQLLLLTTILYVKNDGIVF